MTRDDSPTEIRTVQVGNYRFTGKILGKGTFATVEEAVHIGLKAKVAIKMINLANCNSYIQKHLNREATILGELNHPHILRVFEALMFKSTYCMVTEFVDGGDLCCLLQRQKGKRLDEKNTRMYSRQIATALKYLHGKGIVHRDLKLENIMLDSRHETVKLVDFGLSNHWSTFSPLRTLCGSPEYSAPELFTPGSQYGPEVDMWALGIVVYAMAAGQLPFPCATSIMKTQEKRCLFIRMINNGLSKPHLEKVKLFNPSFSSFLKGLIQPSPNERLSIEDVIKDTWLNNHQHWVPQGFETLDPFDEMKILHQVCDLLKISEEVVKVDLQVRPCGEIAGFYNILAYRYRQNQLRRFESSRHIKVSSRGFSSSANSTMTKQTKPNRISIIGVGAKLNEVRSGKYTAQQNPDKGSSKQQSFKQGQRSFSSQIKWPIGIKMNQEIQEKSPKKIGPLKCKLIEDSASITPKSISRESDKLCGAPVKFKDKYFSLQQPILPSKLKLRYPTCHINKNQIQLSVN